VTSTRNFEQAPPDEVAQRVRQIAAGLNDPADIDAAVRYAEELERIARIEGRPFIADGKRD
jgi:hypothetical protein